MPDIHWNEVFGLSVSPVELFIRGSIVYLFIFVLMRVLRREPGTVGIADLLMVVLIADASQNAMAGDYRSIPEGLILILTIVFWNYSIDWLTAQSKRIERFTYPPPLPLIQGGQPVPENMSDQFVTQAQLESMLREHGIDDISRVKAAYLEGSGHVSVIPDDKRPEDQTPDRRRGVT
jgi:uncharacterized membrane protein YcaP (DUF421 family)